VRPGAARSFRVSFFSILFVLDGFRYLDQRWSETPRWNGVERHDKKGKKEDLIDFFFGLRVFLLVLSLVFHSLRVSFLCETTAFA